MKEKYHLEQVEVAQNSSLSKWKWYFQILPSSFDTPLWWFSPIIEDDQTINWKFHIQELKSQMESKSSSLKVIEESIHQIWNSSFLGILVQTKLQILYSEWIQITKSVFKHQNLLQSLPLSIFSEDDLSGSTYSVSNWKRFLWAHSVFGSRRFSEAEVLVPVLDFFNHSPEGTVQWEVKPNQYVLASISSKDLQIGELFFSYGPKSNEALVFQYGFALESNPHEQIVFFAPFMKEDPLVQQKTDLLNQFHISPQLFLLASTKKFTPQSNWILRLCLSEPTEFEQMATDLVTNSSSNLDPTQQDKTISPMNEKRRLSFISWIVGERLEEEEQQLKWLDELSIDETLPKLVSTLKTLHTNQYLILKDALIWIQEEEKNLTDE